MAAQLAQGPMLTLRWQRQFAMDVAPLVREIVETTMGLIRHCSAMPIGGRGQDGRGRSRERGC